MMACASGSGLPVIEGSEAVLLVARVERVDVGGAERGSLGAVKGISWEKGARCLRGRWMGSGGLDHRTIERTTEIV